MKLFFISLKLLKSIVCVHYYLYVNFSFRKVPTKKDSQFTYVFIDSGRYLPKNGRPRPDRPKLTIPFWFEAWIRHLAAFRNISRPTKDACWTHYSHKTSFFFKKRNTYKNMNLSRPISIIWVTAHRQNLNSLVLS